VKLGRIFGALVKSNDARFVALLCEQADLALNSLELLQRFERQQLEPQEAADAVKAVERKGDEVRRVLVDELLNTYSTPFDREDIFALSRSIDDIIDAADEAARELAAYRIPISPELEEMAAVLIEGARHIRLGVGELLDHPMIASDHAVRAKRFENRMDDLYHGAIDRLVDGSKEIGELLKTRELYRHLKNSADRVDQAADHISMIVIKRS